MYLYSDRYLFGHEKYNTNKHACLQNPAPIQAALVADAGELLRRYGIFLLRDKYKQVSFSARVPQVLKTCIASGTTLVAAENQVRNLRLNPDIGELRIALGIPTGGGWTMSGTTSQYVGTEIDVMISSHSIQLPLNTIDTYKFAASLYFDVFMVAPNLQVHATLNVGVNAQNQHPAVLSVGRPNCGTRMKITW